MTPTDILSFHTGVVLDHLAVNAALIEIELQKWSKNEAPWDILLLIKTKSLYTLAYRYNKDKWYDECGNEITEPVLTWRMLP